MGAHEDVDMRSVTRRILFGLQLCAAAATAAPAVADDATRWLTIQWSDPEGLFPFPMADLAAEARAVFAPLGIGLRWASAEATRVARDQVQVILLARDRSNGRMGERTLACVQAGPRSQAAAWILVPQVRASLGLPADRVPGEGPILARALARVIAHELIHVVAPGLPHASKGLMKPTLGRDFLRRPATPQLDPGLAHAVRSAFEAWLSSWSA